VIVDVHLNENRWMHGDDAQLGVYFDSLARGYLTRDRYRYVAFVKYEPPVALKYLAPFACVSLFSFFEHRTRFGISV